MKLTRKHIGRFFDVSGGDGSWVYQLIDIKGKELLFYTFSNDHPYEIESALNVDWRPFKLGMDTKESIEYGWSIGRRAK